MARHEQGTTRRGAVVAMSRMLAANAPAPRADEPTGDVRACGERSFDGLFCGEFDHVIVVGHRQRTFSDEERTNLGAATSRRAAVTVRSIGRALPVSGTSL